MIQIAIGDIHGRTMWKRIIEDNKDADRFIFIGDYFDTHEDTTGEQQLSNFEDICKFKRETDKEVIMLIGNHDFHYFSGIDNACSGYQPHMRPSFEQALEENSKLLQMVFVDEYDNVYSHAGLTESFLYNNSIGATNIKEIVNNVNMLFVGKPNRFGFYPNDMSGYGDHIFQSCIWVRPNSLYRDGIKQNQIVGHTTQNRIDEGKSKRQGFWLIDTLGTTQEYLRIENGEIKIKRLGR